MSTDPPPAPAEAPRPMTALGAAFDKPPKRLGAMTEEERQALLNELFFEGREFVPFLWRFSVLILLSTMIAALGLVANSVAVIIGAMLVAPLMTPILATSASLVLSDLRRFGVSAAVLAWGMVLAIASSIFVTWGALENLTIASALPSEILGRTQPSLLDLGVAVAAGLAAGYVLTHPRASSALAGVAVAVALVPPLATVGITYQLGAVEESRGALLLFATNLVAILLASIVVMLLSGFVPSDKRLLVSRSARFGLAASLLLLIAVAVPLTLHTRDVLRDRELGLDVADVVAVWDPNAVITQMRADVSDSGRAAVALNVATTSPQTPPAWRLADALSRRTGYVVDLEIRIDEEVKRAATSG